MTTPARFTPYEGWEADVLEIARLLDRRDSPSIAGYPPPAHRGSTMRVLDAFRPPTCGRVLHHMAYGIEPVTSRQRTPAEGWISSSITCKLPAGHHPYLRPGLVESGYPCLQCGVGPEALIHSNGHVADVPEEAWR